MKYSELHRIIRENGWIELPHRGKGAHKVYIKDGKRYVVPYHGAAEIHNNFAKKILKEMEI